MKNYAKLSLALIVIWFVSAFSASALHLFQNASNRIGVAVAVAAFAPILAFALWSAVSPSFRQFVLSLNPVLLTAAHSLANPGLYLRAFRSSRHSPSDFRLTGRLRRHDHRRHRRICRLETRHFRSSQQFYSLANSRNH